MASHRLELQTKLETILGTRNVYFQPPESIKIKYPCVLYSMENVDIFKANNKKYLGFDRYQLKVIDYDPDSTIYDDILNAFPYAEFDRTYTTDGLNHWVLTLYY